MRAIPLFVLVLRRVDQLRVTNAHAPPALADVAAEIRRGRLRRPRRQQQQPQRSSLRRRAATARSRTCPWRGVQASKRSASAAIPAQGCWPLPVGPDAGASGGQRTRWSVRRRRCRFGAGSAAVAEIRSEALPAEISTSLGCCLSAAS